MRGPIERLSGGVLLGAGAASLSWAASLVWPTVFTPLIHAAGFIAALLFHMIASSVMYHMKTVARQNEREFVWEMGELLPELHHWDEEDRH